MLDVLDLPPDSEVLVSAVTIPQMINLIKYHQLVPVPIDLDMSNLQVKSEQLELAYTQKTRMILVAHVFGCRMDLTEVANFAEKHDLFFVEDCAQVFLADGYLGHPSAIVSMFSFGAIKFEKALTSRDNNNLSIDVMLQTTHVVAGLKQALLIPVFNLQPSDPAQTISPSVSTTLGYTISSGNFNFPTILVLTPNLETDLKQEKNGIIPEHSQKDCVLATWLVSIGSSNYLPWRSIRW